MKEQSHRYLDYPILAVIVERSFQNKHLIATIAYQISNYHWAAKTVGSISESYSDEQVYEAVFKYGIPVDPDLAMHTFQIKELEFRKYEDI